MFDFCPQPPDYHLDWDGINEAFEWIRRLKGCPQDPVYHAEGDVWIHQEMVCRALIDLDEWRGLGAAQRREIFWAVLLHDVAKPDVTREVDGRFTARGHSRAGAQMARRLLYRMGMDSAARERIAAMVHYHQIPFWLIERDRPERLMFEMSQMLIPQHLGLLAEADLRGRICEDAERILEHIELFRELAREYNCFEAPMPFASDVGCFQFFRNKWDLPDQAPFEDFKCRVIMMCGLPGAGKDTWIRDNAKDLPMISLDQLRQEMNVGVRDNQGAVANAARELAKTHLRAGRDFVWNATNVSPDQRERCLSLFLRYGAHVRIVCMETPYKTLLKRNQTREATVPAVVIERLIERWETPQPFEAQRVDYLYC